MRREETRFCKLCGATWVWEASPAGLAVRMSMGQINRTGPGGPACLLTQSSVPISAPCFLSWRGDRNCADTCMWLPEVPLRGQQQ